MVFEFDGVWQILPPNVVLSVFQAEASGGPTFSHLNALRAMVRREAYGLAAQKWAEKPLGRPQAPTFCLIGRYQRRYPVATELLQGRWPLVIGAEGVRLRLTALGLMVVSCFADERAVRFPQVQAAQYRK